MLDSGSSQSFYLTCDLISASILSNTSLRISGGIIIGFSSCEAKALIYLNNESVSDCKAYKEKYTLYNLFWKKCMRADLYHMTSILHITCCMVLFIMVIFVSNSYNISLCRSTWCIVKLRNLARCLICLSCNWFCFCRVCKFSLILAIFLALEYTPHPSI